MTYSKTTWVAGTTKRSAANLNNIEAGIEALDQCAASTPSAPSRSLDTVYRNTTGKTILVTVSLYLAVWGLVRSYYWTPDATEWTPTTRHRFSTFSTTPWYGGAGGYATISFAIPPLYYYFIYNSGGNTVTVNSWTETALE